jgi:hypothetical protein
VWVMRQPEGEKGLNDCGGVRWETGLRALDPDVPSASAGAHVVTPAGMVLDGSSDRIEPPT